MKLSRGKAICSVFVQIFLGAALVLESAAAIAAEQPESAQPSIPQPASGTVGGQKGSLGGPPASVCMPASLGSPYVPVDSWVYPAVFRLYGLGFLDHVFLDMR